jgi:hypothetical protein
VIERQAGDVQLFLNLPSWMAPRRKGFALGHEGYTLLPEYTAVGLDDFVYVNTGVRRQVWVMSLPDIRDQWRAEIGYYGSDSTLEGLADHIRRADRVWVMESKGYDLALLGVGSVSTDPVDNRAGAGRLAVFGKAVALEDMRTHEAGRTLTIHLHWRSLRMMPGPYTAFVHVYTGDGQLVAQGDGLPLGGTFPFAHWQPGDTVYDVRHIKLPEGLTTGDYAIGVGLYRGDTGERAPATDGEGGALAEEMYRTTLELERTG